MAHPEYAYAFNELSVGCCETHLGAPVLVELLDYARAWRLHEGQILVRRLRKAVEFDALRKGRYKDKLTILLESTVNRRPAMMEGATEMLCWAGLPARGITAAYSGGAWALSWPCCCEEWNDLVVNVTGEVSGTPITCRHASSIEHLRLHWQRASQAAKRLSGRPRTVHRVDDGMNEARGEVPQIHFVGGAALNIDGVWKHGLRDLTDREEVWLSRVGWVLPRSG